VCSTSDPERVRVRQYPFSCFAIEIVNNSL
jgi:hypothetical protein